jgi:hypothetical protein
MVYRILNQPGFEHCKVQVRRFGLWFTMTCYNDMKGIREDRLFPTIEAAEDFIRQTLKLENSKKLKYKVIKIIKG